MRICTLWLTAIVVAGCTTVAARHAAEECTAGNFCVVEGELSLFAGVPGSVGVIRAQSTCVALALDAAIYRDEKRWNGQRVHVEGHGYHQPAIGDAYWYDLKGRQVALGVCDDGPVIFVEKIELLTAR